MADHQTKTRFYSHLHFQLILLILMAVLPVFLLFVYSGIEERGIASQRTREATHTFLDKIVSEQESMIDAAHQLFSALSHVPAVRRLDLKESGQLFGNIRQKYGYYTLLGLVNAEGSIVGGSPFAGNPISIKDRGYYKEALRTRAFAVGEYSIGRVTGKAVLTMGYPLEDEKGNHKGMIIAGLDLSWLEKQMEKVPLAKGATLTLVDRQGTILARFPEGKQFVGKTLPESGLIQSILSKKEGAFIGAGLDGVSRHYAFRPLKNDNHIGFMALGQPNSAIFAEPNRIFLRNMIWLLIVMVSAMIGALLFGSFFIARKINLLAQAAGRVANGDMTARSGVPGRGNEINRLAVVFDSMAATLQAREAERDRSQRIQEQLMKDLARSNEELKASNKELDDFAYIASHDLREPLRGIINYCTFLMEDYGDKLDADGRSKLETLIRLSNHQEKLIQALLEYSRVGRVDLAVEEVDLNPVVADIIESVKAGFPDNGIDILVPTPLPTVLCDRVRINAVFSNLVTNAVKYNDKPNRVVEIGCISPSSASGEAVPGQPVNANADRQVYYVKDNGIGIRESHIDKIFTIFKRLHAKDKYGGGAGIGLTIAKKIVELHRGTIWVESTFAEGTTFYFTLRGEEI